MKYLLILMCLVGCEEGGALPGPAVAKCESPYYSGPVTHFSISREGILLKLKDGTWLHYPPSVRCEIKE